MAEDNLVQDGAANAPQADSHVHHEMHKEHAHEHKTKTTFSPRQYWKPILAFAIYLIVALAMFYPITLHLGSVAPGTGADTYQNLWDIWWVKYAVFHLHTSAFYTSLLFWPVGANLAFATLAPLNGILFAPFQLLGTIFAYNVMFLLGFALSGFTMYVLADYLTKNHYAALISGFIFTFSAFHIAQSYSHIHFINIEFIPLVIYFFLRILHERRNYLNIIGMAASFALTTLIGNIEQTLMLTFALVLLVIIYLFYKDTRKKMLTTSFVLSAVLFIILAFIIGSWNFIPLLKAIAQPGGTGIANYLNTAASNMEWSITPAGFFLPSYYNGLIYAGGVPNSIYNIAFSPDPVEKVAYIGYAVIALMLFAVYKYRKEMLPWAICALIFAWLALGPSFGLYSVYHALPGINVIREPGRFDLIATLFIAIIAAYGAKALFDTIAPHHASQKSHKNKLYIAVILILLIMFIENNGLALGKSAQVTTKVSIPTIYYSLGNLTGNFSVLALPTLPEGPTPYYYPGQDTFYTSITHHPLVGGYVGGRQNDTSTLLIYNLPLAVEGSTLAANGSATYQSPVLQNYTNETIFTLYNYGTEFVVIHKGAYTQNALLSLESYMVNVFGNPVYNDNTTIAFQTSNTIGRSLFKSFVSYPLLTEWQPESLFLNGRYQPYWNASSPGSIVVYAPYPSTNGAQINPNALYYVNGTISFGAISSIPQRIEIAEPGSGNSTHVIAVFNVSGTAQTYSVNTTFISGALGNQLYFLSQSATSPALYNNITITRAR
jgi:hypothetical protein